LDGIDEYGTIPLGYYPPAPYNAPWPGSYATNYFYNIQDVFNTSKTSPAFVSRLLTVGTNNNSLDRYTFQRLLASIGTGSAPELETFVYGDVTTTNPAVQPPSVLRPKVNLNYDNSLQITNGLNSSPAILAPWSANPAGPLAFFTNAAESLLRSQDFRVTNYLVTVVPPNQAYFVPTNISYIHFGLTNIPVYNSLNPSIRYTEQLHRMLQLAANIYDATTNHVVPAGSLPYPSVYRPLFFSTNYGGTNQVLYIVGYTQVFTDGATRIGNMLPPKGPANSAVGLKLPWDPTIGTNDNVWGIPWVVGAVKGLPAFDRCISGTSWMITRKLLFKRRPAPGNALYGDTSQPPAHDGTNEFFVSSVSNYCGMDALNSYAANVTILFEIIATNCVSIVLTNNSALNPGGIATNVGSWTNFTTNFWRGYGSMVNADMAGGMLAVLQTNVTALPQAYFSETKGRFLPVSGDINIPNFDISQWANTNGGFQLADLSQTTWPVYNWTLSVTNLVMYALVNATPGPDYGKVFDFVNLGPFGTNLVLTNILNSVAFHPVTQPGGGGSGSSVAQSSSNYWDPTLVPGRPSQGVLNQIANGMSLSPYFTAELNGKTTVQTSSNGPVTVNSNLYFSCSNDVAATVFTGATNTLLVNDPLVHYTVGDLTPPPAVAGLLNVRTNTILIKNTRYEPWPTRTYTNYSANMTLKDPLIFQSDNWNFPTNKFPSIGWLGRVHRGTPWQTIFLKADTSPLVEIGLTQSEYTWTNNWVSTLDTYPTNDYALLDLFTTAPNDNAVRGLLSVNQTNSAPWYALFSGLYVNTNLSYDAAIHQLPSPVLNLVVDPTNNIDWLLDGIWVKATNSNGQLGSNFLAGINSVRSAEADQTFHSLGSVFKAPMLSIDSPFLPGPAGAFTDAEVEAIPQQVAGLLKLGQPQFVIYGFGQALKPKDIYFGSQPALFNLCTNYQITGEFVTRTVCHLVGDPAAANVRIQVDSFNILPAD